VRAIRDSLREADHSFSARRRIPLAQNDLWALSCLGLGDAGFNSRNLGRLIACEDARQGIRAVEDCNGTIAPGKALLFRLALNGRLDGKARNKDPGTKHCYAHCRSAEKLRVL
jgi:hypothetical protein